MFLSFFFPIRIELQIDGSRERGRRMIGWDLIRDTRCGTVVVVFGGSAFEMGGLMLGWGCSLCVCVRVLIGGLGGSFHFTDFWRSAW
jgi:hypothetical protein